ncbi:MAG TPA: hypothetical protein VJU78_12735, partial [Chitinophagaceae bacterium]|nr:hypothetical protein [Chitinophagaceae bacterium]
YEKLIGQKTYQSLNKIADDFNKNPLPPAIDPLDLIDPDNAPIVPLKLSMNLKILKNGWKLL